MAKYHPKAPAGQTHMSATGARCAGSTAGQKTRRPLKPRARSEARRRPGAAPPLAPPSSGRA
eukprot:12630965-Alexandrium_andersonii.AAC.1